MLIERPPLWLPSRPGIIRPRERSFLPGFAPGGFLGGGGGGSGSGGIPAALGSPAAWWDPSDLTTLWTGSERVTQSGVGDPVGAIDDKSGNGFLLEAGTTARPLLEQDGSGLCYLLFNGIINHLQTLAGATPCATVIVAARVDTTGLDPWAGLVTNRADQGTNVDIAFTRDGSTSNWYIGQGAGGSLSDSSHIWNNQVQTASITLDANRVYSCDGTGHGGTLNFPNGILVGWDRKLSGRFFAGRIYGLVLYDTILSAADRNAAEGYLATKAGVTF